MSLAIKYLLFFVKMEVSMKENINMENRMETDEEQEETFTLEELEEQLQQLLEEEEYEKAAEIQAKIDERKKSNLWTANSIHFNFQLSIFNLTNDFAETQFSQI